MGSRGVEDHLIPSRYGAYKRMPVHCTQCYTAVIRYVNAMWSLKTLFGIRPQLGLTLWSSKSLMLIAEVHPRHNFEQCCLKCYSTDDVVQDTFVCLLCVYNVTLFIVLIQHITKTYVWVFFI